MIRILIADDHRLFRAGLRKLLDAEPGLSVCGEAADGCEAVEQVQRLRPDVLLLDLSMPRLNGIDALRQMADDRRLRPAILVLTGALDQGDLVAALQLGARGVVLKDVPSSLLIKAIHSVLAGQYWVGRDRVATLLDAMRPPSRAVGAAAPSGTAGLTVRERLIVSGVVAALSNRDIASRLSITEKTVKTHLTNIFDKLGVGSRVELAMYAVRHQLTLPAFPLA